MTWELRTERQQIVVYNIAAALYVLMFLLFDIKGYDMIYKA